MDSAEEIRHMVSAPRTEGKAVKVSACSYSWSLATTESNEKPKCTYVKNTASSIIADSIYFIAFLDIK